MALSATGSGPATEQWAVSKAAASSAGGVVTAHHPLAAHVACETLRAGGSAVDAAIAAGFVLGVVEPWMSGVGGGGVMLIRPPGAETPIALDAAMISSGGVDPSRYALAASTAPPPATPSMFPWPAVVDDRNMTGPESICVPGLLDGYRLAHERFGRLNWADLVDPARAIATDGLPVDWYTMLNIAIEARRLSSQPETRDIYLPDGFPPTPGIAATPTRLSLGALPETLATIRDQGPRALYDGPLARALAADVSARGGPLSETDLTAYRAAWRKPDRTAYRDTTVFTTPGLTGGPTLSRALTLLDGMLDAANTDAAHLFPAIATALSDAFAERLRGHGAGGGESCTTHLAATDADGMTVSWTQTLLSRFGSAVVLPETGLLMNNGMLWFDPQPGRPNSIAAGVKPLANMAPTIGIDADGRIAAIGASGGRRIIGAVLQMIAFLTDLGLSPEQALAQARIDVSGGSDVSVDPKLPPDALAALRAAHSTVEMENGVHPTTYAIASVLRFDPRTNRAEGAASPHQPWPCAAAV
ncbi:gamma-glutamyltransferase [Fodinicurvata sp. EGI_FJ10296]|uniref:gamma-glutamyltransferase family protein n=1 Tax=Fodinicurvata sp. EGI_FJ10296 TaxID=3231908 RepID=UPI0034530EAE